MNITKQLRDQFSDYLKSLRHQNDVAGLYAPIDYTLAHGGKRFRPTLLLLAYLIYRSDVDEALPAAASMEVFHNFTLLHDDIMDDAVIRRGQPSAFAKFGSNQAILSGDVMLIEAYTLLGDYDDAVKVKAMYRIFNTMARLVCEGQQYDMTFETRDNVTLDEYLHMIKLKTAVLLAASLQIGALLGGASQEDQDHIHEFGINAGIAFQIQDDILDTFGDDSFGKRIGGDILNNKKTYLYLKALELASSEQRNELENLYSDHLNLSEQNKIDRVTKLFKSLVVDEYANQVKQAYLDLAKSHLRALSIQNDVTEELLAIADQLVERVV